jgi:hypothetical protein
MTFRGFGPVDRDEEGHNKFWAKVTSTAPGSGAMSSMNLYAWTEQDYDRASGAFVDLAAPRTGTVSLNASLEANNQALTPPFFAFMRYFGVIAGQVYYIFDHPTGGSSSGGLDEGSYYANTYDVGNLANGTGGIYVPGRPIGNWQTSVTAVPNVTYGYPMGPFPQGRLLSFIGLFVMTTGSAGALARVVIYSWGAFDGAPSTVILDSGDIDCSSFANSWVGLFYSSPVTLPPGFYCMTMQFNSVASMPVVLACNTNNLCAAGPALLGMAHNGYEALVGGLPQSTFGYFQSIPYGTYIIPGPFNPVTGGAGPILGTQTIPLPAFETGIF